MAKPKTKKTYQKKLSLYPLKFDEAVEMLLQSKSARKKIKK